MLARQVPIFAVFVWMLTASGCGPAVMDEGRRLMDAGEYRASAEYFLAVLDENPEDRHARRHLAQAGDHAIGQMLAEARAEEDGGNIGQAADLFREIDALRGRALAHGVSLQVPADYVQRRAGLFHREAAVLIARAEEHAEAGRWQEALDVYERIVGDLEPDPAQAEAIEAARARVLFSWAHEEYRAGRYRTARDIARHAADAAAHDPALLERVEDLRLMIEDEGTQRIAFIPVAGQDADDAVLDAALKTVFNHPEGDTVAFTKMVDPDDVRRELLRIRPGRESFSPDVLAEISAAVDADFLVLAERTPGAEAPPAMILRLQIFDAQRGETLDTGHFDYRPIDAPPEEARIDARWESGAEAALPARRKAHDREELIGYADALRKMILKRVALEVR